MYTIFLKELVRTRNKNMAFSAMIFTKYENYFSKETVERFKRINNPNFYLKIEDINESGYVIDTLETVMYAIMNSNSYRETIENCIKVGYDTDTSACIAGSLAGVLYGYENIPKEWLAKLRRREYLEGLSEKYSRTLETMKLSEKRI
jgi:ADP-ribosylglycohydrolase